MVKIRKNFDKREWLECCGKFCDDCKIAEAYRAEYGKKKSKKKFKTDHKKYK